MQDLHLLRRQIAEMKVAIESQEVACGAAQNSLEQRKAAYAVARSVAAAKGVVLSADDRERYGRDIVEGGNIVTAKLLALGEMRKELQGPEQQLPLAGA
jgi:hypothetical protein